VLWSIPSRVGIEPTICNVDDDGVSFLALFRVFLALLLAGKVIAVTRMDGDIEGRRGWF
jgi:hypothetical protein